MTVLSNIGLPFIPGGAELWPLAPELCLIAAMVAVLLTPFFSRKSNGLCAVVALVGLLGAFLCTFALSGTSLGPRLGSLLVVDSVAIFWKSLLLLFVMGIVLLWASSTAASMHEGDGPEFFTLLLGATLGMSLMASTSHLLMIFMAMEMASLPSYVLAGFRKTSRLGAEASLKYVLFGAASSAIMVWGLSLLYGLYGTLQIATIDGVPGIAAKIAASGGGVLLAVALLSLLAGLFFKISAVPMHFWCPDVFEGASIDISAFLSVASKGAALVLLLRIVTLVASASHFASASVPNALAIALGIAGAVTATVGNTGAFVQTSIKRLLAYSSIAHAGYMLCALSLLVKSPAAQAGYVPATTMATAILLYLAVYMFMNLGAFTVAALVERASGSERLEAFAALGRRAPILAACMSLCLFSLVGLPPVAGFMAKFYVLWALIQNGSWWWWLVGVIVVNTVFSLFYYARVLRAMYLEGSERPAFFGHPLGVAVSLACAVILILMLVAFSPLLDMTVRWAKM